MSQTNVWIAKKNDGTILGYYHGKGRALLGLIQILGGPDPVKAWDGESLPGWLSDGGKEKLDNWLKSEGTVTELSISGRGNPPTYLSRWKIP